MEMEIKNTDCKMICVSISGNVLKSMTVEVVRNIDDL